MGGKLIRFRAPWNKHRPVFLEFYLKDVTGGEMTMRLYDRQWKFPVPIAR